MEYTVIESAIIRKRKLKIPSKKTSQAGEALTRSMGGAG